MSECVNALETPAKVASLRIRGELNGERVEDMYLDAAIQQDGPTRQVTASLKDILKSQVIEHLQSHYLMSECVHALETRVKVSSLRIRGEGIGEGAENMSLDAAIQQYGTTRQVTASLKNILKTQVLLHHNLFGFRAFIGYKS